MPTPNDIGPGRGQLKNKTMLPGFQQYLIDNGFTRTRAEINGRQQVEDYTSLSLSSYGPTHYHFKKGDQWVWWGLSEKGKPPVMFLGQNKIELIQNPGNFRSTEDGYRILFSQWKDNRYPEILEALMANNKTFQVDCRDENNITIYIVTRPPGKPHEPKKVK